MRPSLQLLSALSLAAHKERREHRIMVLADIEQDLASLKPIAAGLDAQNSGLYLHHIKVLEEIIKKKKEEDP